MGQPHIRDRKSVDGILYNLDYTYNGVRHRPPLGKNLSVEQQSERALEAVKIIHAGGSTKKIQKYECTFREFLPTYWQAFNAKGRVDSVRPGGIIDNHLLPRFASKPLSEINDPAVGMDYVTARLKDGATAGTIQREWKVLMRILNLAVDFDKLDKNRLKRVPLPEPVKRERVVERWELEALRDKGGDADVWRAAIAAMHTGLREGKVLSCQPGAIRMLDDGPWLYLAAARTNIKGNPETLPLNRYAADALHAGFRWRAARAFGHAWEAACARANIVDLHFHDLRHLFATTMADLGVQDRIIATLMGHKATDGEGRPLSHKMTARYIRKNYRIFRDAVTRLEMVFDPCNLTVSAVQLSPDLSPKRVTYSTITQVIEKQA